MVLLLRSACIINMLYIPNIIVILYNVLGYFLITFNSISLAKSYNLCRMQKYNKSVIKRALNRSIANENNL